MRQLILWVFVLLVLSAPTQAREPAITVLCDPDFDVSEVNLPDPFPGTYYYEDEDDSVYRFGRVTDAGTAFIEAPLTADQTERYFSPLVSPDGKVMAFRPVGSERPLYVWDTETNETATLMLSHGAGDYLIEDLQSAALYWNKMAWQDENTLVIRFFAEQEGIDKIAAQTEIAVSHNPLQLSLTGYAEFVDPILPVPENHYSASFYRSPLGNYSSVVSFTNLPPEGPASPFLHLQVYKLDQDILVFDLDPTFTSAAIGEPIWMPNESHFFFANRDSQANRQIMSVVNISGTTATVQPGIWDAVRSSLGQAADLGYSYRPSVSSDGQHLAFEVVNTSQGIPYHVIYNPYTDEMTAICDKSEFIDLSLVYPIWGVDGDYFGLRKGGLIMMFDIQTGDVYTLPNSPAADFVGWVADTETSATPTDN